MYRDGGPFTWPRVTLELRYWERIHFIYVKVITIVLYIVANERKCLIVLLIGLALSSIHL